jgi:very-short-patch-repair endonuclease
MSDILLNQASQWGGVFATRDATAVGMTPHMLRGLVASGRVDHVAPRAYVLASALHEATTPEASHRLHTLAVLRSFDGRVAASHHSAAALHGLPFWKVDAKSIHVCRVTGRSSRVRGRVRIHESVPAQRRIVLPATQAPATSAALSVIGTAIVDGVEAGLVATDAALNRRLTTLDELEAMLASMRHTKDLSRARQAVSLADPLAESVGETRTRLVLRSIPGNPSVRSQHRVRDALGREVARADFLVGDRVIVEFDGRAKYGMGERRPEEDLWAEKRREDRLRELGYVVIRVVWADLERPADVVARVLAALRRAEASRH